MLHLETLFKVTAHLFLIGSIWVKVKPGSPNEEKKCSRQVIFLTGWTNEQIEKVTRRQTDRPRINGPLINHSTEELTGVDFIDVYLFYNQRYVFLHDKYM